jgi:hypothetical protein
MLELLDRLPRLLQEAMEEPEETSQELVVAAEPVTMEAMAEMVPMAPVSALLE